MSAVVPLSWPVLAAMGGCSRPVYCHCGGEPMWEMFPFDGDRTWTYASTDPATPYALHVRSPGEPSTDGRHVYPLEHRRDDADGEWIRTVEWSSGVEDGVFVHGWTLGEEPPVTLSPPVQLADDVHGIGDVVVTGTVVGTWTSTFVDVEPCPVAVDASWDECVRLEVSLDAGDGFPLAGTWWATKGNGVAAFELAGEAGRWELVDLSCEGECDGSW